jgi:DNA-binding transcriptional regulator YbjK
MKLPGAPVAYEQRDQDQLRQTLEDWMTRQEQKLQAWQDATGTATRTAFDTATVTLPQLAERVKAMLDDSKG